MYNYALKFNFLEVKIAVRESGVERSWNFKLDNNI
jgi:hypothetical protein